MLTATNPAETTADITPAGYLATWQASADGTVHILGDAIRLSPAEVLRWARTRAGQIAQQLDPSARRPLLEWCCDLQAHNSAAGQLRAGVVYRLQVRETDPGAELSPVIRYDLQISPIAGGASW